jgi:uncharacterized protein with HEPN domain
VQWSQIIGLRNRIVHAYFDIDFEIAWTIVKNDLPYLRQRVEKFLN